ncbi:MAG: response regulator transcription factor [Lachnospiraceae bacterium]|nr:response regulator transcription factor [Lachnospiraceae bacterium]
MEKLLFIDDDTELLSLNSKFFENEGYKVFCASCAKKGVALAKECKPDCIILDVMMPEIDGFECCKMLRQFTRVPIIFLTGKDDEDSTVKGLENGGDDYLVKPFSLRELKARINVRLRRNKELSNSVQNTSSMVKKFGELSIDYMSHKVSFKGEEIPLPNREFEVLKYLSLNPDRDITFEELGQAIFGSYLETDRRSVMVIVSRLRKKMDIAPELTNYIETVWAKGYRFNSRK